MINITRIYCKPIKTTRNSIGSDLILHRVTGNVKFSISIPLCMLFNKSLRDKVLFRQWGNQH